MSEAGQSRPLLALLLRIAAMAAIATLGMLVKLTAERGVHLVEILFWRQALTLPILLAWFAVTRRMVLLRTRRLGAHAARAGFGMAGMVCNFLAVILLPLAEATTFGFTAPIFAVLLSIVLLSEKVGAYRWIAVALGFAGVIVIAQPGDGHIPLTGALIALSGAFMVALISIQLRELGKTERPETVVFWFSALSVPFLGVAMVWYATPHDLTTWLLLAAIGASGLLGQLLLTAALRYGVVASVIVMDYSTLIWATLYGWLVWDRLPPSTTWLGAPLVIGAGLLIAWREHRRAIQQAALSGT